jgi:HlyD family secretion protein
VQNSQLVSLKQQLGYIVPAKTEYYLRTNLRQENFGKIALNADVQIRFNSYPYNEFGAAAGKLIYISQVASDSGFLGKIHLVKGLETIQKFKIPYKEGLGAQAVIVTKDMRLLERLYYNLIGSSNLY